MANVFPLCMAVRHCKVDFSPTGEDFRKEITFGFYSEGGIPIIPPTGGVSFKIIGLAFSSAGDLIPLQLQPPLWGNKIADGMHLWLKGEIGFPIKYKPTNKVFGDITINAQFGAFGSINGQQEIGRFLNSILSCNGADANSMGQELGEVSALFQLFGAAEMKVVLYLQELTKLNIPDLVIEAQASFMLEFALRTEPNEEEPLENEAEVKACGTSDLEELATESVWVAGQLALCVYSDEDCNPASKSYLVTDPDCANADGQELTIFRLKSFEFAPVWYFPTSIGCPILL
eukprot:1474153-Rhodomonas_salina.1